MGKSRRMVVAIFGPAMLLLIPAAFSSRYWLLIGLFCLRDLLLRSLLHHRSSGPSVAPKCRLRKEQLSAPKHPSPGPTLR